MEKSTKIGAGATVVLRECVFVDLVRRGHLKIAAGARVVVLPNEASEEFAEECRKIAESKV